MGGLGSARLDGGGRSGAVVRDACVGAAPASFHGTPSPRPLLCSLASHQSGGWVLHLLQLGAHEERASGCFRCLCTGCRSPAFGRWLVVSMVRRPQSASPQDRCTRWMLG